MRVYLRIVSALLALAIACCLPFPSRAIAEETDEYDYLKRFIENPDNWWTLNDMRYHTTYISSLNAFDAFLIALNDGDSVVGHSLFDWITGSKANSYMVDLYKEQIVSVIEKMTPARLTVPDADLTDYKYIVDGIKEYTGDVKKLADSMPYSRRVRLPDAIKNGYDMLEGALDCFGLLAELPGYKDELIDIFSIIFRDYENGYRVILSISLAAKGVNDPEFDEAMGWVLMEYANSFTATMSHFIDNIIEHIQDNTFDALFKLIPSYSLVSFSKDLLLKLIGVSDRASSNMDFIAQLNLYLTAIETFRSAFELAVETPIEYNFDQLANAFEFARQSMLTLYETLLELAPQKDNRRFGRYWTS